MSKIDEEAIEYACGDAFVALAKVTSAKKLVNASAHQHTAVFQEGERLFRAHSHCDIMNGGTQGFPRHEVSDKQEVLFEDVSPTTAFSIRQRIEIDELKMP